MSGGVTETGPIATPAMEVSGVTKQFDLRRRWPWSPRRQLTAVDDISLRVERGEFLGIVGESGSGKTTLARIFAGLIAPSSGRLVVDSIEMTALSAAQLRRHQRLVQIVFQDPYSSLDPRHRVRFSVAEPLRAQGVKRAAAELRADDLLEQMNLAIGIGDRYPHQFSGGQRQRVAIARALALEPTLLVLDEPVSALDVSVQAQVLELLARVRSERELTCVMISHDLAVVRHVSDRIAVMYLGRLVEVGPADLVCTAPLHPYTAALLAAAPIPEPTKERKRERIALPGEPPSPVDPPRGCPFHTRCARARELGRSGTVEVVTSAGTELPRVCVSDRPVLASHDASHLVACHFAQPVPVAVT